MVGMGVCRLWCGCRWALWGGRLRVQGGREEAKIEGSAAIEEFANPRCRDALYPHRHLSV